MSISPTLNQNLHFHSPVSVQIIFSFYTAPVQNNSSVLYCEIGPKIFRVELQRSDDLTGRLPAELGGGGQPADPTSWRVRENKRDEGGRVRSQTTHRTAYANTHHN